MMKRIVFFGLLSFVVIGCSGLKSVPSGVGKYIGENKSKYFMDKDFIKNKDWTEFLHDLKNEFGENSTEYLSHFPNQEIWESKYSGGNILQYLSPHANLPVVGLNFSQVTTYGKWRQERIAEVFNVNYICRLPNIIESKDFRSKNESLSNYSNMAVVDNEAIILSFDTTESKGELKEADTSKSFDAYIFFVLDKTN